MNLAIIGAGESSRLKSEGVNMPKHMVAVNGESLIERIIRIAGMNGIKKVFCIINSHEPELKEYLTSVNFGLELHLKVQDTRSSMHSLFALAPHLLAEPFILSTVDSVFNPADFSNFVKYAITCDDADGILAITRYIDDEKPLCVAMDEDDVIMKFSDSGEGYNWATGGVYYFTPRIFEEMKFAIEGGIERLRNFLRLLVVNGYVLKGFPFSKMIDVDHAGDILKAEAYLKEIG